MLYLRNLLGALFLVGFVGCGSSQLAETQNSTQGTEKSRAVSTVKSDPPKSTSTTSNSSNPSNSSASETSQPQTPGSFCGARSDLPDTDFGSEGLQVSLGQSWFPPDGEGSVVPEDLVRAVDDTVEFQETDSLPINIDISPDQISMVWQTTSNSEDASEFTLQPGTAECYYFEFSQPIFANQDPQVIEKSVLKPIVEVESDTRLRITIGAGSKIGKDSKLIIKI